MPDLEAARAGLWSAVQNLRDPMAHETSALVEFFAWMEHYEAEARASALRALSERSEG